MAFFQRQIPGGFLARLKKEDLRLYTYFYTGALSWVLVKEGVDCSEKEFAIRSQESCCEWASSHQLWSRYLSSSSWVMKGGALALAPNLGCSGRGKARPRYQELVLCYGHHSWEGLVDNWQPWPKHLCGTLWDQAANTPSQMYRGIHVCFLFCLSKE